MITAAGLWISHPKLMFERVGGMTVLERQLITLACAGIAKVTISTRQPEDALLAGLRVPPGLQVSWIPRSTEGRLLGAVPPYISVSGDHFIRPETLRYIASASYKSHVSFIDGMDLSVLQIIPYETEDMVTAQKVPLPAGATIFLEPSKLKEDPVMDWLLSLGFKSQDGFMARHFDRFISLSITKALIETTVSPNAMTLLSCAIGLAGALLFLPTPRCDVLAAGLIWLHSVLDGCDGEMARIRFQESAVGGDIDFWGDNVVHVALFACLAAGLHRAGYQYAPVLGLAAVAGIMGSATLAFVNRVASRRLAAAGVPAGPPGPPSTLARIEAILEQRDFIYLLLGMAVLDAMEYFLWAGAVGAPLFFVLMLVAGKTQAAVPTAVKVPGEAS